MFKSLTKVALFSGLLTFGSAQIFQYIDSTLTGSSSGVSVPTSASAPICTSVSGTPDSGCVGSNVSGRGGSFTVAVPNQCNSVYLQAIDVSADVDVKCVADYTDVSSAISSYFGPGPQETHVFVSHSNRLSYGAQLTALNGGSITITCTSTAATTSYTVTFQSAFDCYVAAGTPAPSVYPTNPTAPTTPTSTTAAPTTAAPTTQAPTTAAPTTQAPTTAAPTAASCTANMPDVSLTFTAAASSYNYGSPAQNDIAFVDPSADDTCLFTEYANADSICLGAIQVGAGAVQTVAVPPCCSKATFQALTLDVDSQLYCAVYSTPYIDPATNVLEYSSAYGTHYYPVGSPATSSAPFIGEINISGLSYVYVVCGVADHYAFQATAKVSLTCSTPTSAVHGDPHLVGFDGSKFDFHGVIKPNVMNVYNFISDSSFSLNAKLFMSQEAHEDGTYMDSLGFVCAKGESVTKISFDRNGLVSIDGSAAIVDAEFPGGEVLISSNVTVFSKLDKFDAKRLKVISKINCNGYSIVAMVIGNHVDFQASASLSHVKNPHGVLGQTLNFVGQEPRTGYGPQGEGVIEGTDDDYLIKEANLFGHNSKFNTFGKNVEPVESFSTKFADFEQRILIAGRI